MCRAKYGLLGAFWFLLALLPAGVPAAEGPAPAPTTVVELPGVAKAMRAGGAGRYLVFQMESGDNLVVVDLQNKEIAGTLNLPDSSAVFAVGRTKLVIVAPGLKMLSRYDLATLKREKSTPLRGDQPVKAALMGAHADGPLLLWAEGKVALWDVATLRPVAVQGDLLEGNSRYRYSLRVSADGQTFVGWHGGITGQKYAVMRVDGNRTTLVHSPDDHSFNEHWGTPTADAYLLLRYNGGVYAHDMTLIPVEQFKDMVVQPTDDPRFFLAIRGDKKGSQVSICTCCDRRPVYTLTGIEPLLVSSLNTRWGQSGGEPRVRFLPNMKRLAVVEDTNNRVVLRDFDLKAALDATGEQYLVVTSVPPATVAPGSRCSYQIEALSKAGGLKYHLESGPRGMTVSDDGQLQWRVPSGQAGTKVKAIVTVSDTANNEVFHTFDLELGGPQRVTGVA